MLNWLGFGRSLGEGFSPETPLRTQRYVVLDTELTSLDNRTNRILSIGAVVMQGSRILLGEDFYREINPGVPVPGGTVLVHGLRPADVVHAEPPFQVLMDLKTFTEGAVIVGHFVSLDVKALQKELGGHGHDLNNPAVDTARVHRWILRNGHPTDDAGHRHDDLSLETLAAEYALPVHHMHHALGDAFLTAQLWQKLMFKLEPLGIRTLGQLMRIAG